MKIKNHKKEFIFLLLLNFPFLAQAEGITDFIDASYAILNNILIPLAFMIATLYFFWGVALYIKSGAQGDKFNEGRQVMTNGIIGLFVAASIWGIVNFIKKEIGLPDIQNVNKQTLNQNKQITFNYNQ